MSECMLRAQEGPAYIMTQLYNRKGGEAGLSLGKWSPKRGKRDSDAMGAAIADTCTGYMLEVA